MVKILRFVKGYYILHIVGFGAERFLNLCHNRQIFLWDITYTDHLYSMKIAYQDYQLITELLEKTGTKADIQKMCGLPFQIRKNQKKCIFFLGILSFVFLLFCSNLFIWNIEYNGYSRVSEEELSDFLQENHIHTGILKRKIPAEELEKKIRLQFDVVKWTNVQILGNTLYIQIKENDLLKSTEPANEKEATAAINIISDCDGIVSSILVRNGVPLVKKGDTVTKGQSLVSGAVPIIGDDLAVSSYQYYVPDADIVLEHTIQFEETLQKKYEKKEYTGREKSCYFIKLNTFLLHTPLYGRYAKYDIFSASHELKFMKQLKLPVFYGKYIKREYYTKECSYSEEEAKTHLNGVLETYIASLDEKKVQIIGKDVKIVEDMSFWYIYADFHVLDGTSTHFEEQVMETN